MTDRNALRKQLATLPSVDRMLRTPAADALCAQYPRSQVTGAIREALQRARSAIRAHPSNRAAPAVEPEALLQEAAALLHASATRGVRPVLNASGILFHEGMNGTPLSRTTREAMAAAGAVLHEPDASGAGERHLLRITGAEAAILISSAPAALWLALDTLGRGKKIIISRGQLGMIDEGTRLLDLLARCGARLVEVGATNKTHIDDYAAALHDDAVICVVRPDTYVLRGFTQEVPAGDLVRLGARTGTPVVYALGRTTLTPVTSSGWRPVSVRDAVRTGAAVTIFGGDGPVGGPACGVAVGREDAVARMRRHPLAGALAPHPVIAAGMEAMLRRYDAAASGLDSHPAAWMMTDPAERVDARATRLLERCRAELSGSGAFDVVETTAYMTASRLPTEAFPSRALTIRPTGLAAAAFTALLRNQMPAVLCEAAGDRAILDLRAVADRDIEPLFQVLRSVLKNTAC